MFEVLVTVHSHISLSCWYLTRTKLDRLRDLVTKHDAMQ